MSAVSVAVVFEAKEFTASTFYLHSWAHLPVSVCPDMQKYRVYYVRVHVRMELFSKRKRTKQTEESAHVCDRGESQQQSR